MIENIIAVIVFALGLLCLLTGRNMLKMIIGIEILTQAITLSLVNGGFLSGYLAFGQSLAIIVISIDVILVAIAISLVVYTHRIYKSTEVETISKLRF